MRTLLFLFVTASAFSALPGCTSAPVDKPATAAASPLEARVLTRHDSLMVLTGRLFELRQRLAKSRPQLPTTPAGTRLAVRFDSATSVNHRADDAMMDWMHAYHRPDSTAAPDSAASYFTRQLRILASLDRLTHRALDSGAAVLRATPVPAP